MVWVATLVPAPSISAQNAVATRPNHLDRRIAVFSLNRRNLVWSWMRLRALARPLDQGREEDRLSDAGREPEPSATKGSHSGDSHQDCQASPGSASQTSRRVRERDGRWERRGQRRERHRRQRRYRDAWK